jgi:hypothetical protein
MTQRIPETFLLLDWSLALIMGNIPRRKVPTRTMITRTKTATPNRTNRPSSENPRKTIEVSARASALRAAGLVRADAWVWSR